MKNKALMFGIPTVILVLIFLLFYISRGTIPPGFKGKVLSSSGYSQEMKDPGKFMLYGREELVLLETATKTVSAPVTVKMADGLQLNFTVNFRTRAANNEKVLNALFNDIKYKQTDEGKYITLDQVYNVYGKDVLSNVARSVVSKYKVDQVSGAYDTINKDLQEKLQQAMVNSPLEVSNVTLANIEWPATITEAINKQQERELAIKTEENQQKIEMVKRTNALELAKADQEIEKTKAETIKAANNIISEGVSDKYLAYKALEVQSKMAENKNSVFVPYETLTQPGLSQRIYNNQSPK